MAMLIDDPELTYNYGSISEDGQSFSSIHSDTLTELWRMSGTVEGRYITAFDTASSFMHVVSFSSIGQWNASSFGPSSEFAFTSLYDPLLTILDVAMDNR